MLTSFLWVDSSPLAGTKYFLLSARNFENNSEYRAENTLPKPFYVFLVRTI
jgi:hypothetical protein